jgi:hypothetical protein
VSLLELTDDPGDDRFTPAFTLPPRRPGTPNAGILAEPGQESRRDGITEDVELLDDELRRLGETYGPLPDDELPRGLPKNHWWWWPAPLADGPYPRHPGWDEPP